MANSCAPTWQHSMEVLARLVLALKFDVDSAVFGSNKSTV